MDLLTSDLSNYYMDLHIHIGRTKSGKPVKITASNQLTLTSILEESLTRKGLDIVGVIDAQSPEVLEEVAELIRNGEAVELTDGGIRYQKSLTLVLGAELEIYDESSKGPIHVLCYFPTVKLMEVFSAWCSKRLKNIGLSSQRIYVTGRELQKKVKELDGWFIPAHVFTPFKSLYGKGVNISLTEVLIPELIDAVELGLSSDTTMADQLMELWSYPFLTNSDAHSVSKIGREHQIVRLARPNLAEITKACKNKDGRMIVENIGLHPRLGKYYGTTCRRCEETEKMCSCTSKGKNSLIKGVAERIKELALKQQMNLNIQSAMHSKIKRPPYLYQIPLEFIPGCGPKTLNRLLDVFQTEMKVLHEVKDEKLKEVIPVKIAERIIQARTGKFTLIEGGGGTYGKMK